MASTHSSDLCQYPQFIPHVCKKCMLKHKFHPKDHPEKKSFKDKNTKTKNETNQEQTNLGVKIMTLRVPLQ